MCKACNEMILKNGRCDAKATLDCHFRADARFWLKYSVTGGSNRFGRARAKAYLQGMNLWIAL